MSKLEQILNGRKRVEITRDQTLILKAIAIMTVIITHANGFSQAFTNIPILKNGTITSLFCQGGMCAFLILSGYGLFCSYTEKEFENYWENKITKIFMPACLIQFIYILAKAVFMKVVYNEIDITFSTWWGDIICTNPSNNIDGSMWYLSYLLFCYLVFFFVFYYIKNTKTAMVVFIILWIISMPICRMIWGNSFYCISSFAVGVIFAYWTKNKDCMMSFATKAVLLVLFILAGIMYYFVFRKNVIIDNIASNLLAFAFVLLVDVFSLDRITPIKTLGKHSYMMYLLQGKIILGIFPYGNYDAPQRFWAFIVLLILNYGLSIAFDYIWNFIQARGRNDCIRIKNG